MKQIERCRACRRVGCAAGLYECSKRGRAEMVDIDYLRERARLGVLDENPDVLALLLTGTTPRRPRR